MVKQLSSVVLSACMLLTMSACAPLGQGIKSFDQSKIVLMQTEQMVAGEDIAVVETSQGDFKMRFFPSEAPKTVENFIRTSGCTAQCLHRWSRGWTWWMPSSPAHPIPTPMR